jgi:hypothetical protein
LISAPITEVISTKGLKIEIFDIALLLIIFMTLELLLLLFQRFASDRQLQESEQLMDLNKRVKQKFAEYPRFMVVYVVLIVPVVSASWIF